MREWTELAGGVTGGRREMIWENLVEWTSAADHLIYTQSHGWFFIYYIGGRGPRKCLDHKFTHTSNGTSDNGHSEKWTTSVQRSAPRQSYNTELYYSIMRVYYHCHRPILSGLSLLLQSPSCHRESPYCSHVHQQSGEHHNCSTHAH